MAYLTSTKTSCPVFNVHFWSFWFAAFFCEFSSYENNVFGLKTYTDWPYISTRLSIIWNGFCENFSHLTRHFYIFTVLVSVFSLLAMSFLYTLVYWRRLLCQLNFPGQIPLYVPWPSLVVVSSSSFSLIMMVIIITF